MKRFSRGWIPVSRLLLLLASIGSLLGCAGGSGFAGDPVLADSDALGVAGSNGPMTQYRLEEIFSDEVEAITGPVGALQSQVRNIPVYLFSDPQNDRMRLFAAIARAEDVDPRLHEVLLTANFHSSLDARYAISNGFIFSVFLHPISSLSPDLIRSSLGQVVSLVETFGTTYSSGVLVLPGGPRSEP